MGTNNMQSQQKTKYNASEPDCINNHVKQIVLQKINLKPEIIRLKKIVRSNCNAYKK